MEKKENSGNGNSQMVEVGGYYVNSSEEISLNSDFSGLVSGDGLVVEDSEGNILYENLRGFLPLSEKKHLLRYADGLWVIFVVAQRKVQKLRKVNLSVADKVLMFDERGKIHYNQMSPYYTSISA